MKRFFTLLMTAMLATAVSAWDFMIPGKTEANPDLGECLCDLYYAYNPDGTTVSVVKGPESYNCELVIIPEEVIFNGNKYTVTIIGTEAFANSSIKRLVMPNTIVEIQTRAFVESSVSGVQFSKGLKYIRDAAFLNTYLERVELFEGLESIGESAFDAETWRYTSYAYLRVAILPSSLKKIARYTFRKQTNLSTVVLPEELEEIEEGAFSYCKALGNVSFPQTLTTIGPSAFSGTGLDYVILQNSVKEVGYAAFSGCSNLKSIVFSSGMKRLSDQVVYGCSILSHVTIPEGITEIQSEAFSGCSSLSSITFPESVSEWGVRVLSGSGIQTVKFPSNLKAIPVYMFEGCKHLSSFTIPSTVETIGSCAFYDCSSLVEVVIPNSVKDIEDYAFYGCAFSEIHIPNSVESLGGGSFSCCKNLIEITLPESIKLINESTFKYCYSLEKVVLPKSITSIGYGSFMDCSSLTSITVPRNVTIIDDEAFSGCKQLRSLTLHSKVETVGYRALNGCEALESIHIVRAISPKVHNYDTWHNPKYDKPLELGNTNTVLYVPRGAKALYEASGQWVNFKDIREEDVDGTVVYQVETKVLAGNGTMKVNGKTGNEVEIAYGEQAVVTIEPGNGYLLQQVLCNGQDVTSQLVNNTFTLSNVQTNYTLEASFREAPVTLTIRMGNGGSMGAQVEKYQRFTCAIAPEDGWCVNSVVFNGYDVTSQVVDGYYTTPALNQNATLSVSFELATQVATLKHVASNMKANVSSDGTLYVTGLEAGERIAVVSAEGKVIAEASANGRQICLPLKARGIYVVHSQYKDVKVCY